MKWNPFRLTGCDDQGAYGITDGWRGERATAAFSLRWSEILKYCWEKKKSRKSRSFYQWRIWCSWSLWALNQNRDVDTDLSFCGYFPTFLYKTELAHFMLIFWDSSRWCLISLSCLFDLFQHENLPTFPKQKKKLISRPFCETGHCHHRRQHSLIKQR